MAAKLSAATGFSIAAVGALVAGGAYLYSTKDAAPMAGLGAYGTPVGPSYATPVGPSVRPVASSSVCSKKMNAFALALNDLRHTCGDQAVRDAIAGAERVY